MFKLTAFTFSRRKARERERGQKDIKRRLTISLLIISGFILSGLSLFFFPTPFIFIFGIWLAVFFYTAIALTQARLKLIYLYIAIIFAAFLIYETYLWIGTINTPAKKTDHYSMRLGYHSHKILGYSARPDRACTHTRKKGSELVFQVIYTINSDGLRISSLQPPACARSILFFGGSFMFGTGVNDNETIPYQAGLELDGEYGIYNFGFRGYGPHQMLAALERGMVESIVKVKPEYAIYLAVPGHIQRSAGLAEWDKHGPKYILDQDGDVTYMGHFDDGVDEEGILSSIGEQLEKSFVLRRILKKYTASKFYTEANTRLFIEIVAEAKDYIETRYPGCEFHMLYWNYNKTPYLDVILSRAREGGIKIHMASEILPDFYRKRVTDYAINKNEMHPGPLAYKLISEYITGTIIGPENEDSPEP